MLRGKNFHHGIVHHECTIRIFIKCFLFKKDAGAGSGQQQSLRMECHNHRVLFHGGAAEEELPLPFLGCGLCSQVSTQQGEPTGDVIASLQAAVQPGRSN